MTSLLFTVHHIHKNFISDILMMSNIHNTYWHDKHYCIYFKFLREIGLASLFQLLILSDDLLFNTKNNWLSCIGIFGVKAPNFFRQSTVSLHRYKINAAAQKKTDDYNNDNISSRFFFIGFLFVLQIIIFWSDKMMPMHIMLYFNMTLYTITHVHWG